MNDEHDLRANVERDLNLLSAFPTPMPDAQVIARVKASVRAAMDAEVLANLPGAVEAVKSTKASVRRVIGAPSSDSDSDSEPEMIRLWAPLLVAAAAFAFAWITVWDRPSQPDVHDPELMVFIDAMDQPTDETIDELLALDEAIDDLYASQIDSELDYWFDPVIFENDDDGDTAFSYGDAAEDS